MNRHQFGSYEIDPRDHRATIDRVSQQDQILQQTRTLLETISEAD